MIKCGMLLWKTCDILLESTSCTSSSCDERKHLFIAFWQITLQIRKLVLGGFHSCCPMPRKAPDYKWQRNCWRNVQNIKRRHLVTSWHVTRRDCIHFYARAERQGGFKESELTKRNNRDKTNIDSEDFRVPRLRNIGPFVQSAIPKGGWVSGYYDEVVVLYMLRKDKKSGPEQRPYRLLHDNSPAHKISFVLELRIQG